GVAFDVDQRVGGLHLAVEAVKQIGCLFAQRIRDQGGVTDLVKSGRGGVAQAVVHLGGPVQGIVVVGQHVAQAIRLGGNVSNCVVGLGQRVGHRCACRHRGLRDAVQVVVGQASHGAAQVRFAGNGAAR